MSHSGRSGHSRRLDVRMKDAEARKAQQLADKLACEAWNLRLAQLGGPLPPSPSLRAAINGGFPWLRVECNGCKQHAWIDLQKVRRHPGTPIDQLQSALTCQPCRGPRRYGVLVFQIFRKVLEVSPKSPSVRKALKAAQS